MQCVSLFAFGLLVLHIYTSRLQFLDTSSFSEYLAACYKGTTAGGVAAGVFIWPLMKVLSPAFSILVLFLVFSLLVLISFYPHLPKAVNAKTRVTKIDNRIKINAKSKKPTLTNLKGFDGIFGERRVGDDLNISSVLEDGVFAETKKAGRKDKKTRNFNLLFPNQEVAFEGSDSLVEPVFGNYPNKKQKNDYLKNDDITMPRFELFDNKAGVPSKNKNSNFDVSVQSVDAKNRDTDNSLLSFLSFDKQNKQMAEEQTSNNKPIEPASIEKRINLHKSEEEKIKDFQNRFKYLFEDANQEPEKEPEKPVEKKDLPPTKEELIQNFNKKAHNKLPDSIRRILDGETIGRTVLPPTDSNIDKTLYNKNQEPAKNISIIESYEDADLDFRPQKLKKINKEGLEQGNEINKGLSSFDLNFEKSKNASSIDDLKIISDAVAPSVSEVKETLSSTSARTVPSEKVDSVSYKQRENKGKTNIDTNFLNSERVKIGQNNSSIVPENLKQKLKDSPQLSIEDRFNELSSTPYNAPPINLLEDYDTHIKPEDFTERSRIIQDTLADFRINAEVVNVTQGPTFARFELKLGNGIKVSRIQGLEDNLAMALCAEKVRILAPVPGMSVVGIEVPSRNRTTVSIKSIIESKEFNLSKSPLTVCLGKDITNEAFVADLEKMPHLLVAGATGSGKSVCINSFIVSLLYKASPDDVRMILIDPKRVEMSVFSGLPHMMVKNVVDSPEKASNALSWALREMEDRYSLFEGLRVKNITEYNKLAIMSDELKKLPRIVIIIDELANLIATNKRDFEDKICKLASLARAAGLHLVVATQRPSVDCVTGSIKANLPTAIAFAVRSYVDSRTILDEGGAEQLLGYGDMLYKAKDKPTLHRMQCAYISNEEVVNVVDYIKSHNACVFNDEVESTINYTKADEPDILSADTGDGYEEDKAFAAVLKYSIGEGIISTSKIQRKFHFGFNRAAGIFETMVEKGYVGESLGGNKPREVLISMDDFRQIYGDDGSLEDDFSEVDE
jgi:DNA segregation ATPase FtsK/SpoIIIE-like protein